MIRNFNGIPIQMIRSKRKTLAIQISEDGLIVRAPMRMSERDIMAFLLEKQGWIEKHWKKRSEQKKVSDSLPPLTNDPLLAAIFGGGGWGGGFGGGANVFGEVQRGFDTTGINNKLNGLENGLCDGFYAVNTGMLNGFHGVDNALCSGFYSVNDAIQQSRFDAQKCCCETNRNIDAVRYEASQNTCAITNAIHCEGEQTRALINANTMQALRDKLADKDRDLMTANFQLSQQAQNATLINELRPCAKPAYITCSPYTSYPYNAGCGCV